VNDVGGLAMYDLAAGLDHAAVLLHHTLVATPWGTTFGCCAWITPVTAHSPQLRLGNHHLFACAVCVCHVHVK
jgi:hypothetical protein